MKPLDFRGTSLSDLRGFPQSGMRAAGYQLDKLQHGLAADDAKSMPTIGAGVMELRIWDEAGTLRGMSPSLKMPCMFALHCIAFRRKRNRHPNRTSSWLAGDLENC